MGNKIQNFINAIPGGRTQRAIRGLMSMVFDDSAASNLQIKDASGKITLADGTSIPAAGTAGYSVGCEFKLTNASTGQCPRWINQGSVTSCLFVPTGPVTGYGIYAAGARGASNGSTTEIISGEGFANTDIAIAGHIKSNDDDYIASVAMTDDEAEMLITADADPLTAHGYLWAALRNQCAPGWDIAYAGTAVSTAATTTAITVAGVLATDIAPCLLSGDG